MLKVSPSSFTECLASLESYGALPVGNEIPVLTEQGIKDRLPGGKKTRERKLSAS